MVCFGLMHSNDPIALGGKVYILLIKLKVVELMTHVYHLQDTNSLASLSAMSLLCLSALSSSAWCMEGKKMCTIQGQGYGC